MNVLLCLWLLCGALSPVKAEAQRPASAPARQYLDASGGVTYSLVDGYPLRDEEGKVLAEVTLRVLSPVVPSNQRLQVEWTLSNAQPRGQYLNPGLHRRIVPTGEFIFFDQDGWNLRLPRGGGSFLTADWITLEPGERFTASSAEPLWFGPGRYSVQLVYFKRLLQPPPHSGLPPVAATQPFGFREELFRSNPVWFEVVAKTDQPTTQPRRTLGPSWQDERPLNVPEWGIAGAARITVLDPRPASEGKLRLRLEFSNTGREWAFYDLFPSRRLVPPLVVALYDPETKESAGTLSLIGMPTGFLNPAPQDWTRLPSEATVSQVLDLAAPSHRRILQIVFLPEFVRPPEGTVVPEGLPRNPPSLQGHELFRSNAVLVGGE